MAIWLSSSIDSMKLNPRLRNFMFSYFEYDVISPTSNKQGIILLL